MPGIGFMNPVEITGQCIEDEFSFLTKFFTDDGDENLIELVFAYFENFFINHPDFDKIFNGMSYGDFEKLRNHIEFLAGDYRFSPSAELASLILVAIEAALEGANYHKESSRATKVFNEDGMEVHWTDGLQRIINGMCRRGGPGGYHDTRFDSRSLECARRDYQDAKFKLHCFEEDTTKFLLNLRNGSNQN